ncbi:ribonuclease Z [Salisediminibacterium beveridgei]|uniref:Ribonuclease Z n=1 Tax=Salisediminibacterium beveridgei TaxID=632773 RepID=A0A1D7QYY7_9BACI|nr:ribonuclease Z [Salisediminibacterium beveridgei]AOM84212.1 Ribonuclease Z [Salisediminibacterium beveridgei]
MEIIFLGTGAGIPGKERNVSAIALKGVNGKNDTWLIDCGEGTQHQMLHAPVKANQISRIFITHLHGDHIFGLPGFLGSRSFQGATSTLFIYGPEGLKGYIEQALTISGTHLNYEVKIEEIKAGQLFQSERWQVSCCELDHRLTSYGYRFAEADRPGKLDVTKLERDGIPKGPWLADMKKGHEVTLPDGRVIAGSEYVTSPLPGRIIAILGDTRPTEQTVKFVQHADLLVHEATFMDQEEEAAKKYGHSTTLEASGVAKRAGVKRLILTHISSRYRQQDMEKFKEEARRQFPNTEVAADFAVYHV